MLKKMSLAKTHTPLLICVEMSGDDDVSSPGVNFMVGKELAV